MTVCRVLMHKRSSYSNAHKPHTHPSHNEIKCFAFFGGKIHKLQIVITYKIYNHLIYISQNKHFEIRKKTRVANTSKSTKNETIQSRRARVDHHFPHQWFETRVFVVYLCDSNAHKISYEWMGIGWWWSMNLKDWKLRLILFANRNKHTHQNTKGVCQVNETCLINDYHWLYIAPNISIGRQKQRVCAVANFAVLLLIFRAL